jgi:hypothetical protein
LLGQRRLPKQEPRRWQGGSRDEAALYALQSREAWLTHNALIWLRKSAASRPVETPIADSMTEHVRKRTFFW